MWRIRNETDGLIMIEDLNITLKPKQEFDLDFLGREKAENSSQLAVFINKGIIKLITKEEIKKESSNETINQNEINKIIQDSVDNLVNSLTTNLFSKISEDLSHELVKSFTVALKNIPQNLTSQDSQIAEDDFEDISLHETQAELLKGKENLSSNFKSVGKKQEIDSSDDIAQQLRNLKKGK
jgi:hypothetical protein